MIYKKHYELTETECFQIKNLIKQNFEKRNFQLDDDFINHEFIIITCHIKLKHSHHMNSLYCNDIKKQIRNIMIKN